MEELYKEKSILLKALGENPKLRIIDFFLDNPLFDFTKKEVFEALGMNKQTFYKYFAFQFSSQPYCQTDVHQLRGD